MELVLVGVIALWIAGFGLSMVFGQHQGYADATRRFIAWVVGLFFRLLAGIWHRWHYEIILMAIGAGATLAVLHSFNKL